MKRSIALPTGAALTALLLVGGAAPAAGALQAPDIPFERLVQPFLRTDAAPLTAEERQALDGMGNRNGVYDIGDLRLILYAHPELIPGNPASNQAPASSPALPVLR